MLKLSGIDECNCIITKRQNGKRGCARQAAEGNGPTAANEFREALNGDLQPKWTEVWSRIFLGKVFDITGQRERAVIQYKQAERTNDNTQGALEEAAKYLKSPYRR